MKFRNICAENEKKHWPSEIRGYRSDESYQLSPLNSFMKYLTTILFLILCTIGVSRTGGAQNTVLTADETLAIPKLTFDPNGELKITASATSSHGDFDFLVGKWKMHNRRLNKRLENCKDWTEFESSDENHKILSGTADIDTYSTTEMPGQEGKRFEGLTLRLFNPKTRLWSLYWLKSFECTATMLCDFTQASDCLPSSAANSPS